MNSGVAEQSVDQLSTFLERGNIAAGMPAFADLPVADRRALAHYLLDLNVGMVIRPVAVAEATRKVTWGSPRPGDWLSYNGNDSANRFSPLKQINTKNVSKLKLKWIFPVQAFGLETTPLAADGVLYVTPALPFGTTPGRPAMVCRGTRNSAPTAESRFYAIRFSS
jgi:hypothetical protein